MKCLYRDCRVFHRSLDTKRTLLFPGKYLETRSIDFITDSYGFRNKPLDEGPVYDILLLGDSFTVGNGTTQESTWATLLSSRYNLKVYNLAIPGSPWHSYVNLAMEMERLDIRNRSRGIDHAFYQENERQLLQSHGLKEN